MKVTVLGFWGGYPEKNEATSGYLFESKGFSLLVDCGSGVLAQLQNFKQIDQIDAVILSHYHHDHKADIGVLQYARLIQGANGFSMKELPIYGHPFDQDEFAKLTHPGITLGVAYDPEKTISIGPFSISFFECTHPVTTYAMKITDGESTVVYSADSSYDTAWTSFVKECDLFICECNMYANQEAKKAGHMNSTEVGTLAKDGEVKELLLTHLPHFGDTTKLVKEAQTIFDGPISLAKTGFTWGK